MMRGLHFAVGLLMVGTLFGNKVGAQTAAPPLPSAAPKIQNEKLPSGSQVDEREPDPNVWDASEIDEAQRLCADALERVAAKVKPLPPIKKGACGDPAPVRLISIGKKDPIFFKPAPTISCRMLVPLKHWIRRGLQPMAERHLDTRVKTVSVMSSYSCRTRYGRAGARMSEHAFANALDIGGFRLIDGRKVNVLKHWGPTKRDIAKAIEVADAKIDREAGQDDSRTSRGDQRTSKRRRNEREPQNDERGRREQSKRERSDRRQPSRRQVARVEPRRNSATDRPGRSSDDRTPPLPRAWQETVIVAPLAAPRRSKERRRRRSSSGADRRFTTRNERRARTSESGSSSRPFPSSPRSALPRSASRQDFDRFTRSADEPDVRIPPLPARRPLRRAVPSKLSYDRGLFIPRPQPARVKQRDRSDLGLTKPFPSAPFRLGGPKPEHRPHSLFLKGVHRAACRIFGTTLGPEANEAHRNHFHFDMFPRKRRGYCE